VRLAEVIQTTVPKHSLSHYCIWRSPTLFCPYLPEARLKSLNLLIKVLKITVAGYVMQRDVVEIERFCGGGGLMPPTVI